MFILYLRLHLIQEWVFWSQLNGLVPLLNGLPVPKENTLVIQINLRKLRDHYTKRKHDLATTVTLCTRKAVQCGALLNS